MPFELRSRHPVILCVDDESEILASLSRSLRSEPYEVITARGAAEALGWFEELPIDLVITDQRMPGGAGTDLLREVRKRSPNTARAILTGHREPALLSEGREAGAETFLFKPWDDRSLKETIRRMLRKGADS